MKNRLYILFLMISTISFGQDFVPVKIDTTLYWATQSPGLPICIVKQGSYPDGRTIKNIKLPDGCSCATNNNNEYIYTTCTNSINRVNIENEKTISMPFTVSPQSNDSSESLTNYLLLGTGSDVNKINYYKLSTKTSGGSSPVSAFGSDMFNALDVNDIYMEEKEIPKTNKPVEAFKITQDIEGIYEIDFENKTDQKIISIPSKQHKIYISPVYGNKYVIVGYSNGEVDVYDLVSKKKIKSIKFNASINASDYTNFTSVVVISFGNQLTFSIMDVTNKWKFNGYYNLAEDKITYEYLRRGEDAINVHPLVDEFGIMWMKSIPIDYSKTPIPDMSEWVKIFYSDRELTNVFVEAKGALSGGFIDENTFLIRYTNRVEHYDVKTKKLTKTIKNIDMADDF